MIRKQRGMISVESRKLMTSELSFCWDGSRALESEDGGAYLD